MKQTVNTSQTQGTLHCFLFEPSVYITLLASIEGDVATEEIKEAVAKVYTQNETTMSKVVLENGNVYFEQLSQSGCKVFVDSREWQEIMHESEQSAFRINEGELVRTYIIPGENGYTLFIMAHHIMGDGKALLMLLEDILCNLTGKEVEYRPLNRAGAEKFPYDQKLPMISDVAIKAFNAMWKKKGTAFTWQDYYKVHEKFWRGRQSDIRFEVIEKEQLQDMKTECKQLRLTVNSYIVTKLLQKQGECKNFCCPISIRGENRSISNLVILVRMNYQYNERKSFGENAAEVHKVIKRHMEDRGKKYFIAISLGKIKPTLLDSALLYAHGGYENKISKKVAQLFGYAGDNKTHLSVTNLQNIHLEDDYGRFRLKDISLVAACMSATKNVACVSTFRDKMKISYCSIKNQGKI